MVTRITSSASYHGDKEVAPRALCAALLTHSSLLYLYLHPHLYLYLYRLVKIPLRAPSA